MILEDVVDFDALDVSKGVKYIRHDTNDLYVTALLLGMDTEW